MSDATRAVETPNELLNELFRRVRDLEAKALSIRLAGPLGELGYAETTSGQGPITTVADLTGVSIAVNVLANRRIRILGQGQTQVPVSSSASGLIREGSTTLGRWGRAVTGAGGGDTSLWVGAIVLTPSAGAHTYKLSAEATSGSVTTQASALTPVFILVEDIGPA